MSQVDAVSRALFVVSISRVTNASRSQLYFASLLAQRRVVGGQLRVALRRLRTIAGEADFDHLRVAQYPEMRALDALRLSPLVTLLDRAGMSGVQQLRASQATVRSAPADWRELRAVWALFEPGGLDPSMPTMTTRVLKLLARHPETHASPMFQASLAPLPDARGAAPPPPVPADALTLVGFPSTRIAIDTLALSDFRDEIPPGAQGAPRVPAPSWTLLERISLREMLTPA